VCVCVCVCVCLCVCVSVCLCVCRLSVCLTTQYSTLTTVDRHVKTDDENLSLNVAVSCQKKVQAYKRFLIHTPPNVLTLQLKRYVSGAAGYKLNRHLNFSLQLDLRPFVTEVNDTSVMYKLYAVLVHCGMTTTSGHYYCCVLTPSGHWFKMNDAVVCSVLWSIVWNLCNVACCCCMCACFTALLSS